MKHYWEKVAVALPLTIGVLSAISRHRQLAQITIGLTLLLWISYYLHGG